MMEQSRQGNEGADDSRSAQSLSGAGGWRLAGHAQLRVRTRGFRIEDVLIACVDPEIRCTSYNYGPDRVIHYWRHLAVVVEPQAQIVITVLLRGREDWDDDDARRVNSGAAA